MTEFLIDDELESRGSMNKHLPSFHTCLFEGRYFSYSYKV